MLESTSRPLDRFWNVPWFSDSGRASGKLREPSGDLCKGILGDWAHAQPRRGSQPFGSGIRVLTGKGEGGIEGRAVLVWGLGVVWGLG